MTKAAPGQRPRLQLLIIGALVVGPPLPLYGQQESGRGHAIAVGVNAISAGVVGGLVRKLRGGGFRRAFLRAATGGTVAYCGRVLATAHFDGAGLLGRQISAAGAAVVRNSMADRPALERLVFVLGPLHLYLDRSGDTDDWRLRVDPIEVLVAATLWSRPDTRLDWKASASAGVFVLRSHSRSFADRNIRGSQRSGVVLLPDDELENPRATFAHERVHVLQRDFTFHAWGAPMQDWLAGEERLYRTLTSFLDIDVAFPLAEWVLLESLGIPYRDRPREIEAAFLGR